MIVYWLYDASCSLPQIEGYVGVTNNLRRRLREHRRRRRGFDVAILLEGDAAACFALESDLRPRPSIGWNNGAGGPDGRKSGHSEETRKKIGIGALGRQHMRGKKLTPEHRAAISAALKGRPALANTIAAMKAARSLVPPPMLGKKHSPETIAKMKAAKDRQRADGVIYRGGNGGYQHTEKDKAKIREARARQPEPHLGKRHTDEVKAAQSVRAKLLNENRTRNKLGRFVD